MTAYGMARKHPPELQAPPYGRNPGARAVRSRNLPLGAALDALKCHKSEIMDIFLNPERPQAAAGAGWARGVRWTTSPLFSSMVSLRNQDRSLPGAAGNGLDCHRIVANLVVTAL